MITACGLFGGSRAWLVQPEGLVAGRTATPAMETTGRLPEAFAFCPNYGKGFDSRGNTMQETMVKFNARTTSSRMQRSALAARPSMPFAIGVVALCMLGVVFNRLRTWFDTPSRPYEDNVGDEYDKWTREGTLEHYWGEHIHMGAYKPMKDQKGYSKDDPFMVSLLRATLFKLKDFKQAKIDFVYDMIEFSHAIAPTKILDVGCGIGGTSRILAKQFPDAEVVGITLSPEQVARGSKLAKDQGLPNARFEVMDALNMTFEDNTFDLVWGCESLEHMPDKKKYFEEMVRVLKPGGRLAVASWCERDPTPPFTQEERKTLEFLYKEWAHPYFESVNKYKQHLVGTGAVEDVETADWTQQTLPSWRHSIWVAVWSPVYWIGVVVKRPRAFLTYLREVYTLEKFHRSMQRGLMIFGMLRATKKAAVQ